jgi:hypothetical protein
VTIVLVNVACWATNAVSGLVPLAESIARADSAYRSLPLMLAWIGDTPFVDLLFTPSLLRDLADTQAKELAIANIREHRRHQSRFPTTR